MLGLALAGLANGFAARAITSIGEQGWYGALFSTFDISAIVWIACFILLRRLWEAEPVAARPLDIALAALCIPAFLLPLGQASWVALSVVAVRMIASGPNRPAWRDAGLLLLAICLPMFWARLLLSVFSGPLLDLDATLVGALLGVPAAENTVPLADGSGVLWIAPACSSVLNIALTLVCAAALVTGHRLRWSRRLVTWTLATCAVVSAINILRLCALARFPEHYEALHGPEGGAGFAFLILVAMVGMMAFAVKHERAAVA